MIARVKTRVLIVSHEAMPDAQDQRQYSLWLTHSTMQRQPAEISDVHAGPSPFTGPARRLL